MLEVVEATFLEEDVCFGFARVLGLLVTALVDGLVTGACVIKFREGRVVNVIGRMVGVFLINDGKVGFGLALCLTSRVLLRLVLRGLNKRLNRSSE